MKAAFLTETGFEIREIDIPPCGDDEILIKIIACGVCSGDVFVHQNRMELAEKYPRLGHEASGIIAAVGKNVAGFAVGDQVTTFGASAYAAYLVTSPKTVVKLPTGVDPVHALGEPISCCVHAGWRFGTRPGDRVALIGCGFMGLVCQQIAIHQGAEFVLAMDPLEERRDLALSLGADAALNPIETDSTKILEQYGEFDLVIEAVGNQSALDLCTPLVKEHGLIILIGYHQSNNGLRTVDMEQWNLKAIDVVNGHVRREDEKLAAMQQGVDWLAQGHLTTKSLVTTYPFSEIESAFQDLAAVKPKLLKAVFLINS